MSLNPNGKAECDRCGADCGNGGIDKCAVVSLAQTGDNGARIANLHWCNFVGRLEGSDPAAPPGERCVTRVLTVRALAHYAAEQDDGTLPAPVTAATAPAEEPATA